MPHPPILVPLHVVPSPIEQEHIKQALEASQTAIAAIGTVATIAACAVTILAVMVAIIAFWGWSTLKSEARAKAKQIASATLDSYVKGDDFKSLMQDRIDAAVKANWQTSLLKRLEEAVRTADDLPPFPVKEGEK